MQSRIQCGVRGFCTWYPISLKPLTTTKFRPFLWTTRKSYLVPIYIGDQVSYTWPPPPCSEVPANGGTLADVECPTSSRLIIIDIINVILGSKKFDFPNLIMWILCKFFLVSVFHKHRQKCPKSPLFTLDVDLPWYRLSWVHPKDCIIPCYSNALRDL